MKGRKRRRQGLSLKVWTILCVALVCVVALLLRGIIVYQVYPLDYKDLVAKYSDEYALDPYFVCALIRTESSFNEEAVSSSGAVGLMQIMPETGAWAAEKIGIEGFAPENLSQPEINIRIGCWYLRYLDDMFEGDKDKVMAGYNAGPGKVKEWVESGQMDDIPYAETKNYLVKVTRNYGIYKGLYDEF